VTATIEITDATPEHGQALADIYNAALLTGTATFETEPREARDIAQWLTTGYPLKVALVDGQVAGFAKASAYRDRDCYAGIWEYSVYVDERFQRRGIGAKVLQSLIESSRKHGAWKLLSRIFPENGPSIELAKSLGFRIVGTYQRHGQLRGVWKDCVIVELGL
jgi:phosphinothricin acetyltransferase